MKVGEIKKQIIDYQQKGLALFASSSFQTHSIVMLHILSQIDNTIPIYFVNTGYLFPETIEYKDLIAEQFGLTVVDVKPLIPKSQQKDVLGNLLFTSDPDYCCYINKVQPLEQILMQYDVWINGVRADQTEVRKNMSVEQSAKYGVRRYHPMLDWDKRSIYRYIKEHQLPKHPLEEKGYLSIGCEPCTRKVDLSMGERASRWFGLNKTECGLNTDLVDNE